MTRYMVFRRTFEVMVPASQWHELELWPPFRAMCCCGLTRADAVRLAIWDGRRSPPGTRYFLQPIDVFLAEELTR